MPVAERRIAGQVPILPHGNELIGTVLQVCFTTCQQWYAVPLCVLLYRCYSSKIVPHLILTGKTDALKGIADHCKQPLAELVQASLPTSMVFILTAFAQQGQQDSAENSQGRMATATRAHDYIIGLLGKEV